MNWKWWVAVQLAILAFLAEMVIPFSEAMLLSIIWKLDRRIFWLYIGYDAFAYGRAYIRIGSENLTTPSTYEQLSQQVSGMFQKLNHYVPQVQPQNAGTGWWSTPLLIGAGIGLVVVMYYLYWIPIRAIIKLRRRILKELLHQ